MQAISQYPMRPVRSFVRREGRITKTQSEAFEMLWPIFGLSTENKEFLDLDAIFGRKADKIVEIGFGDGHTLLEMAMKAPEKDFIGIEVYRTGVGSLLAGIAKHQVTNIRIFCSDAIEVLEHKIPDDSLAGLQLFFADPWPKKRHHKRRIVQTSFVNLVARKVKKGGIFHLATDWMDYAYHMMSVISEVDTFQNIEGALTFSPRPDFRPLTKYEQRGLQLGHQTWDLIFRR